ncbi:MAG: hypothetical protein WCG67_08910 [Ferruginibacter sp.]
MENNIREQKILSSLDGLVKATAPEFFYTRLKGKMQNVQPEKFVRWQLRPLLTVSLSIGLLLNIFSLLKMNMHKEIKTTVPSSVSTTEGATILSFANAYNLNIETVYE